MSVHSESGLLVSTFGIRDGRVWLEHVCGGHLTPFEGSRHELRSELQAALRA